MQIINLAKTQENSKLIDLLLVRLNEVGISAIRCYFEGQWQLEVAKAHAERAMEVVEQIMSK